MTIIITILPVYSYNEPLNTGLCQCPIISLCQGRIIIQLHLYYSGTQKFPD